MAMAPKDPPQRRPWTRAAGEPGQGRFRERGTCLRASTPISRFNFPGRKHHPELDADDRPQRRLQVSTSPDGSTIRNRERRCPRRRCRSCFNFPGRENHPEPCSPKGRSGRLRGFNFPGRKNHPEPPGSCSCCRRGISFNFPGRKNHPELEEFATSKPSKILFQLPRTEEPSGTPAASMLARPGSLWFQLPRTEEPSGTGQLQPIAAWIRHEVSTSPDGRTIRNWTLRSGNRASHQFQLPRTEEPSGTRNPSSLAPAPCPCFNFPGRKNHPERSASATAWVGSSVRFQLPRTEEPSGTRTGAAGAAGRW